MEKGFNLENFISNAYKTLKDNGILVSFGSESSISQWNSLTQQINPKKLTTLWGL
ncbi:hypothetical protein ABSA28_00928 [Candidatus Hepatincolaceae symbiont of Richtersius coronifer]